MGTNYYHHVDPCPCCGRANEVEHIGKSSAGWTFSFHGTPEIRSWSDWHERLKAGGKIVDEYDRTVTLEEFEKLVAATADAPNNHTIYCLQDDDPFTRRHGLRDCWLDDEGHSFDEGEFS